MHLDSRDRGNKGHQRIGNGSKEAIHGDATILQLCGQICCEIQRHKPSAFQHVGYLRRRGHEDIHVRHFCRTGCVLGTIGQGRHQHGSQLLRGLPREGQRPHFRDHAASVSKGKIKGSHCRYRNRRGIATKGCAASFHLLPQQGQLFAGMPAKGSHGQVAGNVHTDGLVGNQHIHLLNVAQIAQGGGNGQASNIQGFIIQKQSRGGQIHRAHAPSYFYRVLSVKGQAGFSPERLHRVISIVAEEGLHHGLSRMHIMAKVDGNVPAQKPLSICTGQKKSCLLVILHVVVPRRCFRIHRGRGKGDRRARCLLGRAAAAQQAQRQEKTNGQTCFLHATPSSQSVS